jgi:antitoxin component of MazEF toxin-antitoxin module
MYQQRLNISLRGTDMHMVIKKWGNSLATRIPKAVVDSIDLRLDQEVEIEAVNGRIIITPLKTKKEYKLEELLSQCKPGSINLSSEDQEWLNDDPVGKEAW